jgi:hypothetical protein
MDKHTDGSQVHTIAKYKQQKKNIKSRKRTVHFNNRNDWSDLNG